MLRKFSSLISCRDLSKLIAEQTPVYVFDATLAIPGKQIQALESHFQARVPGAKFFDIEEISDKSSPFSHTMPTEAIFNAYMKALRLKNDDHLVVCYDKFGAVTSPRAWYMFKAFQKSNVKVLDGGFPKWERDGLPVESGRYELYQDQATEADVDYNFKLNTAMIKQFQDVQELSKAIVAQQVNTQIVDARSPARFSGEAKEPRPGLRSGNIPGSKNVFFADLFNEDMTFKSPEALQQAYAAAGVVLDNSRPAVHSCGSGITACITLLGMDIAGHTNSSLYDGSWTEYGTLSN